MVTEDFKKVAVSFAGGDGGNPNSGCLVLWVRMGDW